MTCAVVIATPANPLPLLSSCPLSHSVNTTAATSLQWEWDTSAYSECCLEPLRAWLPNLPVRHVPPFLFWPLYYHHHHHHHGVNSENYCKDHCSGGEIMTNEKWNSKSNSLNKYVFSLFLNAYSDEADVTWLGRPFHTFAPATGKAWPPTVTDDTRHDYGLLTYLNMLYLN